MVSTSEHEAGAIKVVTSRFGEVEVVADKIITMTVPVPGFPESKHFFLRPHGQDSPFMWLQSLENPALAFVVINPVLISPAYQPAISAGVMSELAATAPQELELLVILTIPAGRPRDLTANLLGPVVINAEKRLAKQVVLDPLSYDPCFPVFGAA